MSKAAHVLNLLLSRADIALTRRTTLDRTRAQLASALAQRDDARSTLTARSAELDLARSAVSLPNPPADAACLDSVVRVERDLQATRRELLRHQIAASWSVVDAITRGTELAGEVRTCAFCSHTDRGTNFKLLTSHCIFGGGALHRYQCPACDVIFGPQKMLDLPLPELEQEYEWHYKAYEEGDSTEAELRVFHSLKPRRDGLYVNYGAGAWSRSVQVLRAEGWNVVAYEPHASASAGAEWVISSHHEMDKRQFDGLFSNNVLEHLRYPVVELQRMARWLAPGALMAHATPCYEYRYEYTRFHLFFFPGRSREKLAQMAGFSIQQYEVDGDYINCVFLPEPEPLR